MLLLAEVVGSAPQMKKDNVVSSGDAKMFVLTSINSDVLKPGVLSNPHIK